MKEAKVIIIVILLLFINCNYGQAGQVINFGELAPTAKVTVTRLVPMALDVKTVSLELKLISKFLQTDTNQRLPGGRMKVKTEVGNQPLSSTPIQINKDHFRSIAVFQTLPLTVTTLPVDHPGKYKGRLIIKQLNSQGQLIGFPEAKELVVTVVPWLILEQIRGREVIRLSAADYKQEYIFSRGEPVLQIAANTDWKLYGFLEPDNQFQKKLVRLEVPVASEYYTEVRPERFYLDRKPQKILVGSKTTSSDNYWVQIPIKLTIKQFTKLKAGSMEFPINFAVAYFD